MKTKSATAATDLKPGVAIVNCNDGLGYWTMYGMV